MILEDDAELHSLTAARPNENPAQTGPKGGVSGAHLWLHGG
jgi:hypothetical protein